FDLRQTLEYLVAQVKSQLDVDAVDILIYHPNSQSLVYESGSGFNQDALIYRVPSRAKSLSDRVAAGNEIVFVPDLRNENNLNLGKILAEEGFISYYGVPLKIKDELKGVMEIFHRQPLQPDSEWLYFLEGLARQAAIAIDNATLFDDLLRKNAEMSQAYDATIVGWSRALELRDRETEGHAQRVTNTAVHLARKMGIRGEALIHVRRGALLHDIGKMGIPDSILHKPGPLSEDEWEIMRQHPTFAYALIYPIEFLRQAVEIPYCHHERWDGSGYPRNLIGNSIPLAARIFAIIDVWDALSSDRPYRPAWEKDRIIAYLQKQSGTHFDPDVVIAFMEILPELDF
ncbi:MAG: HD domain-containing protein, partial [Anaerolineaceae bacterium]|nr:HD domain-containing protein [Anaerolineaceae bacterium]